MSHKVVAPALFDAAIIKRAVMDAFHKLDPRELARNPVIFVTEAVSAVVTIFFIRDLVTHNGVALFSGQIAAWLWFTVLFANFAEAVAKDAARRRPMRCARPAPIRMRSGSSIPITRAA
jgi:K+-transporting ATPase ATPase B chain